MAGGVLTEPELRAELEEILGLAPGALVVGVRSSVPWAGGSVIRLAGESRRVVWASSTLEIREALTGFDESDERLVILTPLDSAQVGRDVLGRLARGRLFTPDTWRAVLGAFKARRAAGALQEAAIAQALIDHAPPDGYPPVPTGVLDEATAWRALYRHAFGLGRRDPDLAEWLRWAASEAGRAAYAAASRPLKELLRRRVARAEDPAVVDVLDFVESGAGADAVALAIACGVVFPEPETPSSLPDAAARLERFHADRPIEPAAGVRLAAAAERLVAELRRAEQHAEANRHIQRADELLVKVQADRESHRSRLSPAGFNRRLDRLATALLDALERPESDLASACEAALRAVTEHDQAGLDPERIEAARTAVRLARWPGLHREPDATPLPLAELAAAYREGGAFVDLARETLIGGDPRPTLADAYRTLEAAAAGRREAENRAFAAALAEWSGGPPAGGGLVPVEEALARFVAPLMKGSGGLPVLLIVLDGLSWPIAHALLEPLRAGRWHEVTPDPEGRPLPPVVAALPTITKISRASLLAGRLASGTAAAEKAAFAEHSALREGLKSTPAPVLFHKAEIDEAGQGRLDPEVRDAVASERHRLMGVVVNAVDEHLAGSSQIGWNWTPGRIRPLRDLLEAAFAARRVVAIASDHGHVRHRDGAYRSYDGAGVRWRPDAGVVEADEVRINGPRVRTPAGQDRAILPWQESTRYGLPRNGYHGGATPQEVVVPFVLLAPVPEPGKGLGPGRLLAPPWWLESPPPGPEPVPSADAGESVEDYRGMPLLEAATARRLAPGSIATKRDWVDRLLSSEVFVQQRQAASRLAPGDDRVALVLRELDRRGGQMTAAALATRLGLATLRLPGFVAQLQRLLNVDGYPILNFDRDRDAVTLDAAALRRQFELE